MNKTTILLISSLLLINQTRANDKDLFKDITFHKLENGMEVILAPNDKADTTMIELQVDVGTKVENGQTWGANHLLEHVLFSDSDLADDQNYLQVVEEMGGTMNGASVYNYTHYYVTVPKEKSVWATGIIHKMIFQNNLTETAMNRAKKSVLLEIGEPSWLADIAGFWPTEAIYQFTKSLQTARGFWEEAYGYKQLNDGSSSDREFAKDEIVSAQSIGWWSLMVQPKRWYNFKMRYFNLDPFFWRKGVLISLKNGKSYYLGCADSEYLVEQITVPKIPVEEDVTVLAEAA